MVFRLHGPHFNHHITQVYLTQALVAISHGLIGIFIPIYLITLGYSLEQALAYFVIHKVVIVLASPLSAYLNHKLGFKRAALMHVPFFVLSFGTLYALSFTNIHYSIPAVLGGFAVVLYWIPINTLFIKYSHKKNRGAEVGTLQAIRSLFSVAAPAIGGVIAAALGFPILIVIALSLGAIAVLPLFFTPEIKAQTSFSLKDVWRIKDNGFMGVTVGDGFLFVAVAYLFPVFIYLTLQTTTSVGFIESFGMIVFAIGSYLYGKRLKDPTKALKLGAILVALSLIIRPFLSTAEGFALVVLFGALAAVLYQTGYNTLLVDYGRNLKELGDEYVVVREMYMNASRAILLGLCIIFPWTWGFFIAATALIGFTALYKSPTAPQ